MARDIKFIWDSTFLEGDLELDNGDLTREEGLSTAVLISLFTDARADEDDEIDDPDDKRGWWGDLTGDDEPIGSKLWQYNRAKTTQETLIKVKKTIEDCLQWMIQDGVAEKIDVITERFGTPGNDKLGVEIKIYQSDGNETALKFDDLWKGELNAI
jgi:phage gp46-like protein